VKGAALVTALLLCATACATRTPVLTLAPDDPQPRLLLANWIESVGERRALRGQARLAVDREDGTIHLRGKQLLLLKKPSSLRVEILGFLNQSQAVLVTDGDRFEVYRAHDHSYESGQVDDSLLWNEAGISLSPEEAVSVLLGAPTFEPGLSPAGAVRDGDGRIRIDLTDADGVVRQRVTFDPAGPLHGFELLETSGETVWIAQFREYRDVGGVSFAHAISLDVAAGKTHAEISFRDLELNPALPAELFQLRLPAGFAPPATDEPPRPSQPGLFRSDQR
jgi:hypothetical protein